VVNPVFLLRNTFPFLSHVLSDKTCRWCLRNYGELWFLIIVEHSRNFASLKINLNNRISRHSPKYLLKFPWRFYSCFFSYTSIIDRLGNAFSCWGNIWFCNWLVFMVEIWMVQNRSEFKLVASKIY
jgi:hypothetical protein